MVGSLEFATGKLGSRLILVLGHTNCGAIAGATKTYLEAKAPQKAGSALQGLLQDLGAVAEQAAQEAGPGASADEVTARAVKARWRQPLALSGDRSGCSSNFRPTL